MYGLGVIVNGLVIVGASFAALILKKFIMKFDKNNKRYNNVWFGTLYNIHGYKRRS